MALRFGTDGVRGVAGSELTAASALGLAAAAVQVLRPSDDARPLVVVGRDPRPSGDMLLAAVVAGLTAAGADVVNLGVVPTPAVVRAVADGLPGLRDPDAGVVVSASHNPMPDNGIKLVGPGGTKLSEDTERAVEAGCALPVPARTGLDVGRLVADLSGDHEWYVSALLAGQTRSLAGLRVVVDCANGAAAGLAGEVYGRAGAEVVLINDDRTGTAINADCGAMHLEGLSRAVVEHRADVGIAHDGDADRALAVTAGGAVVDGDAILAILGIGLQSQGRLAADTVVATVMSNLGLRRALTERGISLLTTPVGDRHVTQAMRTHGLSLGGEQSGHIVLADRATTGDGLLTGLALLSRVVETGSSLGELAGVLTRYPQALVSVTVADRDAALRRVEQLAATLDTQLGDDGRVLVRPSGTEPLLRIMVEADTVDRARRFADELAEAATD